jgi:hypothetical protein
MSANPGHQGAMLMQSFSHDADQKTNAKCGEDAQSRWVEVHALILCL